jgi:hypothetical protein
MGCAVIFLEGRSTLVMDFPNQLSLMKESGGQGNGLAAQGWRAPGKSSIVQSHCGAHSPFTWCRRGWRCHIS